LLAGHDVFAGMGPLEQLVLHTVEEPTPLTEAAEQAIPPALAELVMQCLAKDPAARPASMGEVITRLEATGMIDAWTHERACAFWDERRRQTEAKLDPMALGEASTMVAAGPDPEAATQAG